MPDGDPERWKGVKPNHPEDCRDQPIVWSTDEAYIFELDKSPREKVKGKPPPPHQPLKFIPVGVPRSDVLRLKTVVNGHYHNIGNVPQLGGYKTVFLSEPVKALKLI